MNHNAGPPLNKSSDSIPYDQFQHLDINKPSLYKQASNMAVYKMTPQDFIFLQKIGSGSYSEVYKAKYKKSANSSANMDSKYFAIKICSKKHIIKEQKEKYVNVEKRTLLQLSSEMNHPGIVNLFYTFHDEFNLYFVLDYIPCGELFNYLYNSLNKSVIASDLIVLKFVSQLIDTLCYLKRHSIVHRDLKPENILLDQKGCLMITDFGVAVLLGDAEGRSSSFVGTADYVSPELLMMNSCSFKADIWALGCIFYQLKQGAPPFRGGNELETFENIVSGSYKKMSTTNTEYKDLVEGMLRVNERKRFGLDEIMSHPFCKSVDWDDKSEIWTGIWEGAEPIDTNEEFYLKQQRNNQQQPKQPGIALRPKNTPQPPLRTKGIGYPKKRKPVTTQNIVEWRKQLGLNTPYGQQGASTPSSGTILSSTATQPALSNVDYANFRPPLNQSSQAAAQVVLKKQMMSKGRNWPPNNQYLQPPSSARQSFQVSNDERMQQLSPQHMKTATLRQKKNDGSLSPEAEVVEVGKNGIVKKEDGILFYKIPFVDKSMSQINLDYYTIKPSISGSEENCGKFLNFMKKYSMKTLDILNNNNSQQFSLQLLRNGEIQIINNNEGHVTVLGDLSDKSLYIYEYTPERKESNEVREAEDLGWCVIELERKHLVLLPGLNKDWNRLFKKIKTKNEKNNSLRETKNRSKSDQAMIKNAASMAFAK